MMKLKRHEHIVTAWPECASGPGWANQIIWVIISDGDGKLRQESIQPEEQSRGMVRLFSICATAHREFLATVRNTVNKKGYGVDD